jgi:hypothetical protein
LVEGELARLRRRKAGALDEIDEHERMTAEAGIGAELSKPLKLLQRYESACWRRQQAALRILQDRTPKPMLAAPPPAPLPPPSAAPEPQASRPQPRTRPEARDDRPARPPGSKPLSSMTLDELFATYDIPFNGPAPAGLRGRDDDAPRPDRRT